MDEEDVKLVEISSEHPTDQYLGRLDRSGIRGPKPFAVTDKDRATVKALRAVGCTREEIASYLGISSKSVYNRFKPELEEGKAWLKPHIASRIIAKALRGDNACMFFLMKTQYGWCDQPRRVEVTGAHGGPVDIRTTPTDNLEQAYALLRAGAAAGADAPGAGEKVYEGQPSGLV